MKEIIREALYGFIDYYTQDELDRVDLKLIADNYIEDDCGKEELIVWENSENRKRDKKYKKL